MVLGASENTAIWIQQRSKVTGQLETVARAEQHNLLDPNQRKNFWLATVQGVVQLGTGNIVGKEPKVRFGDVSWRAAAHVRDPRRVHGQTRAMCVSRAWQYTRPIRPERELAAPACGCTAQIAWKPRDSALIHRVGVEAQRGSEAQWCVCAV